MTASCADGSLAAELAQLSDIEILFLAHDWMIWARDDQLPPAAQTLLARHAPPVVEQLLEGLVIYRLPPERLATLRAAGRGAPPQLRVQPDGLRLELAP